MPGYPHEKENVRLLVKAAHNHWHLYLYFLTRPDIPHFADLAESHKQLAKDNLLCARRVALYR